MPTLRIAQRAFLAAVVMLGTACQAALPPIGGPAPTPEPRPLVLEPRDYLDGLNLPVSLEFAPDGRLFFVEVSKGQLRVAEGGVLRSEPVATIDVVKANEHGLIGMVLHPRFLDNGWVYLYYTSADRRGRVDVNRVIRLTIRNNVSTEQVTILDKIPPDVKGSHNGGRMRFGPDGRLYVGTGQQGDEPKGEPKLESLEGKMLRLNDDGSAATDNPFPGTPVYAMGLRNPYGFDFHPRTGVMYGVDNGPKGYDEVNMIKPGGNYGWPAVIGAPGDARYSDPLWHSGTERHGMSGFMFYRGDLFPEFAGDAFQCLWNTGTLRRLRFGGPNMDRIELTEDLTADCRLDVANGPDGAIYLAGITKIYRIGR